MCRVLEVSRSGYYSWCRHEVSKRQRENDQLLIHIRQAYVIGRGTYGSPRVTAELRANGVACGRNRVARLMRQNGINFSSGSDLANSMIFKKICPIGKSFSALNPLFHAPKQLHKISHGTAGEIILVSASHFNPLRRLFLGAKMPF